MYICNMCAYVRHPQVIDDIYDKSRYKNQTIQEFHIHLNNFVFNKPDPDLWKYHGVKWYEFDPSDDIMYNANISIKNDRLIRISCLNYQLNKSSGSSCRAICDNAKLYHYLDKQTSDARLFTQMTIKDLQNQCDMSQKSSYNNITGRMIFRLKEIVGQFKDKRILLPSGKYHSCKCRNYEHVYCMAKSIWFISPLFVFSRMFYFVFPIISLIAEFNHFAKDKNESLLDAIDDIVFFQLILFVCYYGLVVIWIINLFNVCRFYYWTKLIGIGSKDKEWVVDEKSLFWRATIDKYNKMIDDVAIQEILWQYLGKDIASIVFEYYVQISRH